MLSFLILCIGIFVTVNAGDEKNSDPSTLKCMEEFKITEKTSIEQRKEIESCFGACVLKAHKVITDTGMFDKEEALKYFRENEHMDITEKSMEQIKRTLEICEKVNDAEVSDGDKGCERSALLLKCFSDNKE